MAMLHTTRVSLFLRIGAAEADPRAWNEFVATYGPAVLRWCRSHGLQETDAQDVSQDVLIRFWRQAARFRYDPSRRFRSYLSRIVRSALANWSRAVNVAKVSTDTPAIHALVANLPARDELAASLERSFDVELLSRAMAEVEVRVKPRTWAAFRMLAIDGRSGRQVADELGMTAANAYMARMNVQRMISETVRRLESAAATVG